MPSRAYTSFLRDDNCSAWCRLSRCQCPLGLIPHFYSVSSEPGSSSSGCVNALSGLYLISTFSSHTGFPTHILRVNALSGLYLISTVPLQKPRFYAVSRACFCRYLSEYSDKSSFSCMFTIWTYLTRQIFPNPEFTIAQNYSSVILFFYFYSL